MLFISGGRGPVSKYPSIFGGFVLGSIDASDSESRIIFSHFSRSTQIYTSIQLNFQNSGDFRVILQMFVDIQEFCKMLQIFQCNNDFSPKNYRILLELRQTHEMF